MIFFTFLFSLLEQNSNFCSCIPLCPIDEKQYNQYSLIAKAEVIKATVSNFERTIYLKIETYYKNTETQTQIKVTTPNEEGACGITPKIGEHWLIFAYTNGKDYKTEICTRTKNMNPKASNYNKDEIDNDIKFLEAKISTSH